MISEKPLPMAKALCYGESGVIRVEWTPVPMDQVRRSLMRSVPLSPRRTIPAGRWIGEWSTQGSPHAERGPGACVRPPSCVCGCRQARSRRRSSATKEIIHVPGGTVQRANTTLLVPSHASRDLAPVCAQTSHVQHGPDIEDRHGWPAPRDHLRTSTPDS
jgi:hypothetical protein